VTAGRDDDGDRHWFEPVARHAGAAYLRYSFTKGTEQEVGFLVDALGLQPGMRVLDVGCGPGRHALALARRGIEVVGVDISAEFIALARDAGSTEALPCRFEVGDARELGFSEEFDAAISLCQGAFGLLGGPALGDGDGDLCVLTGMRNALVSGGRGAISAFSAYFAVRFAESSDTFDAATGVNHERSSVRNAAGEEREFDLWTSCFTPRELRLLTAAAGLVVDAVYAVTPGGYRAAVPDLEQPEFLLLAHRPAA
jgi:SAM-dependent methyltransferase